MKKLFYLIAMALTPSFAMADIPTVSVYADCSKNGYTMGIAEVLSTSGRTSCEYVQLWEGGPKWATFNVGAAITSYANLSTGFSHKSTLFYGSCNHDVSTYYNTANLGGLYAWNNPNNNGRETTWTNNTISTGISDVATTLWGSNWKTPTQAQLDTLYDENNTYGKTTWTWCDGSATQYVAGCTLEGYKVSGVGDYANYSIFLPAVGIFEPSNGWIRDVQNLGCYWSSTEDGSGMTFFLSFGMSGGTSMSIALKSGLSVRAVLNDNANVQPVNDVTLTLKANSCSVSNIITCPVGKQLQISAEATTDDNIFSRWSDGNTDNPRTITVSSDTVLTAVFISDTQPTIFQDCALNGISKDISATATANQPTLTIYSNGCSTPNIFTCSEGQEVYMSAIPQAHYDFSQWTDGNTDNPRTVTVNSNMACIATFVPKQYTISTPTTNGQVTGGGTYTYGTQVQLTAIADAHSSFVQWSDGVKDNPRTITVVGDTTYSPIFVVDQHTVTISVQNGTVSGAGKYNYGTQIFISATANYGYHFTQWSDGNTDNPRSVTVISDTAFTALCEVNSYTISATATNGTFIGTGQYIYMSTCSLTAVPDDHYHFVQWSDGVKTNPRTITVMGDSSYSAIFAIDQHTITVTTTNGTATGSGTYNYGTNLTLTVTPPFCYQFISWSDGNTDNPRSIVVAADATYNAFCEKMQVASGTCGDNLTWTLDLNTGVLTISGTGDMTDYTSANQTPWYPYLSYTNFSKVIFNEGITHIGSYAFYGYSALKEVSLPHTVQTIGKYAFAECRELEKVTLGEGLLSIGNYAFSNCIRMEEMTCLANRTPDVAEHTFNNVSHFAYVYVRSEYLHKYQVNMYWNVFDLKTIGAQSVSSDGQVSVEPNIDNAVFTWPTDAQAASYSLEITKEGAVFCTLTFNSLGQLVGLAFAPGRGAAMEATEQAAIQSGNGFTFTVTGLNSASAYAFNMDVKDSGNQTIKSYTGTFQTKGGVVTNLDNQLTNSPVNQFNKIIKDNQLIILREGKMYNAQGTEVR